MKLNLDYLKEMIWKYLALITVYTKKPGRKPDFEDGLILRSNATVEHACHTIHRSLVDNFKYAQVWGLSAKYDGQHVGLTHKLSHEDVMLIAKK